MSTRQRGNLIVVIATHAALSRRYLSQSVPLRFDVFVARHFHACFGAQSLRVVGPAL
jgi:hypothetical protein